MEELKTKAWCHNMNTHFGCVFCGEVDEHFMAAVSLVAHEDWKAPYQISSPVIRKEMSDAMLGVVCRDCIKAGPQGAAKKMLDYVEYLREEALKLENLVGRVARITEWASIEDLKKAERHVEEDMRGGPVTEQPDRGMPF